MEENKDKYKNSFHFGSIVDIASDGEKPSFDKSTNKLYYKYGTNNNYGDFLLELYNNKSAVHKSIINKLSVMVAGNGFIDVMNPSVQYTKFVNNVFNAEHENLEDVIAQSAFDLRLASCFALEITWSRDRKTISNIAYIPFNHVRIGTEKGKYWLSEDWENYRKEENRPIEMQEFSLLKKSEFPVQILYYKAPQPGSDKYNTPVYSPAFNSIDSAFEINRFHNRAIKNNFQAGYHISNVRGIPSGEEMQDIHRSYMKGFTSTTNANKLISTYAEDKDSAPIFTPLEMNGSDEQYDLLYKQIKLEIFTAHDIVSPELFGDYTESGGLGSRDELLDKMALLQVGKIDYSQRQIERVLNKLAKINGVPEDIELQKYKLFPEDEVVEKVIDGDGNEVLVEEEQAAVNSTIKGMTGREMQGMMRIIRKFEKGDITEIMAIDMLKSGFGLTDEQAKNYLNILEEEIKEK